MQLFQKIITVSTIRW